MLLNIDITNAALIDHLSLDIGSGMTVLTGETGAGKSVIIDSINLILGARTSKTIVRHGEKKAVIQAVFEISKAQPLEDAGIPSEDGVLIVTREISSDGKSLCRANGIILPQNIVREIGQGLINIHGQHDSQALLNPSMHIAFLDSYAKNESLLSEYAEIYNRKKELEEKLSALEMDEAEKNYKTDLLSYQIDEIEKAAIKAGEKDSLSEERVLIANGEKIVLALNSAYEALYGGESSAYDALSNASEGLSKISGLDDRFAQLHQRLTDLQYSADDISHEIYDIASETDYDEERLNEIEARLDMINRLERKYGGSEEAVLEFYNNAVSELSEIQNSDFETEKLLEELRHTDALLGDAAKKLTESRQKAGDKLAREVERELCELDMPNVKFSVFLESADFSKKGSDKVEFMISPNKGEPQKPLDKIASGGELSRIMLALKTILADGDDAQTLIFDEVDAGVSGSAAKKIAQKLSELSKKKQVICVSHQPQIAAAADNHIMIKKSEIDGRTVTTARLLDDEQRVSEIARIIDGDNITKTSIEHAEEMIRGYKKGK